MSVGVPAGPPLGIVFRQNKRELDAIFKEKEGDAIACGSRPVSCKNILAPTVGPRSARQDNGDDQKSRKPTKSFRRGPDGYTGRDEARVGNDEEVEGGGPDASRRHSGRPPIGE